MPNPPEHMVYRYCRRIFTDDNARMRQSKAIQKRLEACKHLLQPLLGIYKLDAIVTVAKLLLEKRIFESPMLAREAFPTLFTTLGNERQALEIETTKSEAADVERVAIEDERESDANKKHTATEDPCKISIPTECGFHD